MAPILAALKPYMRAVDRVLRHSGDILEGLRECGKHRIARLTEFEFEELKKTGVVLTDAILKATRGDPK